VSRSGVVAERPRAASTHKLLGRRDAMVMPAISDAPIYAPPRRQIAPLPAHSCARILVGRILLRQRGRAARKSTRGSDSHARRGARSCSASRATVDPPLRSCVHRAAAVRRPHRFYSLADYYPKVHVTRSRCAAPVVAAHRSWVVRRWRLLARPRHGADLPAAPEAHAARGRGPAHAGEGIFHNLVFVSIDKQYPGQRTR